MLQTYLRHDAETRRLMLVMTDYYNGQHERTEFTVVNPYGDPITTRADLTGLRVHGGKVRLPATGAEMTVLTVPGERAETVRTECPRAVNKRRKCNLCAVS